MTQLEIDDIQGIILRTYGTKRFAQYLFLTITDVTAAKQWLATRSAQITTVGDKPAAMFLNIGITMQGMKVLGLGKEVISTFPDEITDGPLTDHKLRMLGDTFVNDPKNWYWGNKDSADQMHLLVMIYTDSDDLLKEQVAAIIQEAANSGLSVYHNFPTHLNKDNKEHFGYRDGISQPGIVGFREPKDKNSYDYESMVAPGEFVLGYENEYKVFPTSPMLKDDQTNLLKASPLNKALKDLGRNGSYLVFRQLEEDVKGFWNFVQQSARDHYNMDDVDMAEYIGAKMFGRWTNGASISVHSNMEAPNADKENDFKYAENDFEGLKCPVGSHARRANPRDAFYAQNMTKTSEKFLKKHRLIRRARPYGDPIAASMELKDILAAPDPGTKRGIYFICINADFARQFEFMQQTWIVNPKFKDFYADPDPFIGNSDLAEMGHTQYFTIPEEPVRQRLAGVQTFVTTKGSAYFFMPGKKALQYIAGL